MSFILNCEPLSNSVWVTIEFFLFLHDYKYPTENTISTLSMRREPAIQYTLPLYSPCGILHNLYPYRNLSQTYQFLSQRAALILRCILQGLSSLLVVIATDDVKWQELHLSSAFSHYHSSAFSHYIPVSFNQSRVSFPIHMYLHILFNYHRIIFW